MCPVACTEAFFFFEKIVKSIPSSHFPEKFVWWGGVLKKKCTQIIYRKIFFGQNQLHTTLRTKRGRWVYEGE